MLIDYDIIERTVTEGYDRKSGWFQPRIGWMAPRSAILTMTRNYFWASDIFTAVHTMLSKDGGATWSEPKPEPRLDRRVLEDGYQVCPCDLTPAWHDAGGKMLAIGHTATYTPGERGVISKDNSHSRDVAYATYDPATGWEEWRTLDFPDPESFFWTSAGCSQRLDLDDGTILLPISAMSRRDVGENFWKACFGTTILRLAYDGESLNILSRGNTISVDEPRGLYEPSLAFFKGRYYITLRNDARGYVAHSDDGLNFSPPIPWCFDDGVELGSYNTQQHWIATEKGLFLVYTRRGANNDEVIRHRAPLFIAQVDPERLCVMRESERVAVPNRGAQLGNFGCLEISEEESWIVTSECMLGDAKNSRDIELTESRGANNRVIIARVRWK